MAQGPFVKLPRDLSLVGLIDRLNLQFQRQFAQSTEPSTVDPAIGTTVTAPLWFDPDNTFDIGLYVDGTGTSDLRPKSIYAGTKMRAPLFQGDTQVIAPLVTGSTQVTAPLVTASTRVTAPLLGTTTNADVVFDRNSVPQLTLSSLLATFAGGLTVAGTSTLNGHMVFGDASTDRITGSALVDRNWSPTDALNSLGGVNNRWIRGWFSSGITIARDALAGTGFYTGITFQSAATGVTGWSIYPVVAEAADAGYNLLIQRSDSGGDFAWLTVVRDTGAYTIVGDGTLTGDLTVTGDNLNVNGLTYTWPASQTANRVLRNTGPGTLAWSQVDLSTDITGGAGVANYLTVWTGTSAFGVQNTSTFALYTSATEGLTGSLVLERQQSSLSNGLIFLQKLASDVSKTANGSLGIISFRGTTVAGTTRQDGAYIEAIPTETWSASVRGTKLKFSGRIAGGTTLSAFEWDGAALWPTTEGKDLGLTGTRWGTGYFVTEVVTPSLDSGGAVDLVLQRNNTTGLTIGSGSVTAVGNLLSSTDNTVNLGAVAANRYANGYFGTSVVAPTGTFTNVAGTLTTASQPNVTTMANLTTIGTLVAGAVPASLVTAGTFGPGNYTFPGNLALTGSLTGVTTLTTSGAINGQTISSVASFTGSMSIAGPVNINTTGSALNVGTAAGATATALQIRAAAGVQRDIAFLSGSTSVWTVRVQSAESGGDAGASLNFIARTDAGTIIDVPLAITRAAGGTIAFASARPITGGTYNGQTISSAASFTGTLAVTTSVTAPLFGTTAATNVVLQRGGVTQLTLGSLTATFAGDLTVTGDNLNVNGLTYTWPAAQTANRVLRNTGPGTLAWSQVDLSTDATGTLDETLGGTGLTSYALGDILYASASNTLSKLAGQTTTTKKYLQQVGNGSISAAPSWQQVAAADIAAGTFTGSFAFASSLTIQGSMTVSSTGMSTISAPALYSAPGVTVQATSTSNYVKIYGDSPLSGGAKIELWGSTHSNAGLLALASAASADLTLTAASGVVKVTTDLQVASGKAYKVNGTQVVSAQGAAVADASGGATVDTEARAAINALLARVRAHGLIAT